MSAISISFEDKVSPALLKAAADLPGVVEKALDRGYNIIEQESGRQMNRIYNRPIPRGKRLGKPLWARTGALAGSRARESEPGRRALLWDSVYAHRRFGLGYDWTPTNPAGGVIRRNQVADDTARIVEPLIVIAVEQELTNGLP